MVRKYKNIKTGKIAEYDDQMGLYYVEGLRFKDGPLIPFAKHEVTNTDDWVKWDLDIKLGEKFYTIDSAITRFLGLEPKGRVMDKLFMKMTEENPMLINSLTTSPPENIETI